VVVLGDSDVSAGDSPGRNPCNTGPGQEQVPKAPLAPEVHPSFASLQAKSQV